MASSKNVNIRLLMYCPVFFILACHNNPIPGKLIVTKRDSLIENARMERAFNTIASLTSLIRNGDLITRTGNDFASETFRSFNRYDKTYSHCGIASIEHDSVFVYHALGGEFNPDEKIRRDALELFATPYGNRGIGIFRYPLNDNETKELLTTVKKWFDAGIMFDMKFDLATNDRMYCAEFVSKSYAKGTHDKLHFACSRIKDFEFIGVDNLFLHPLCHEVKRAVYK